MKARTKTKIIQLAGLVLCFVCALSASLYYIDSLNSPQEEEDNISSSYLDNTTDDNDNGEYDPMGDINNVILPNDDNITKYDYYEKSKNYNMASSLKAEGYSLSQEGYDPMSSKIGVLPSNSALPGEFSLSTYKVDRPVTTEGNKGGYYTEYESVTEDAPVLTPYYGYIIYRSKGDTRLLDSNGNTLHNLSGYEPAYMTDYAGNPLFKKEDKYYFYYSGKNYKGAAYSEIENDTIKSMPVTAPEAYQYFVYDRDMLQNYFATNKLEDAGMTGIVYYLPDYSDMVEFKVDENALFDLTLPVQSYNRPDGKLFRFPEYVYTKTEAGKENDYPIYSFEVTEVKWGYMNEKGEVVIAPQYKKAYNFSDDGLAVVEDKHGHICVINEWGSVVFNAYNTVHYFPELGYQRVRDGHYTPDTYGIESIGMFRYDKGFARMRRKLVDTENGYIVRREMQSLVDKEGNALNLPSDYSIEGYTNGIMLIKRGDKYGYMRSDGSWLIEPELTYAQPFCEGVAVMGYSADTLGLIDTEGNSLLYGMYSYISNCSGGVITAYSPVGGWSIFHIMNTGGQQAYPTDPTIELKKRAIAEAKHEFYVVAKEKAEMEQIKEDK